MLIFHVVGGVGVSLLSLIPRLIKRSLHVCVVSVGVAGWNTSAASVPNMSERAWHTVGS